MARFLLALLLGETSALVMRAGAAVGLRMRGGSPVATIALDEASEALPFVTLTNAAGDSAKVYPFGACVTSYVKGDTDYLMVRPDAVVDGSKPISGGIPFCFPQFGPGAMQQHGFARNLHWEIASQTDGDAPSVVFKLTDNEYTRAMWDFPFEALYTVTLGAEALSTEFKVINTGDSELAFTGALHSYWSVSDISNLQIAGPFEGATYLDKLSDTRLASTSDFVEISKPTDSVYEQVGGEVSLLDSGRKTSLKIASEGWTDTVVWNPYGEEKMGYAKFVCVECAKAIMPIVVAPTAEWVGKMSITPITL
uniref:glucose-6-phosphate 1-epimerase n=1 Tax=Coccolithus braarudii TaxID=221442 RepID=A0A7S0Q6P5_9EUKA|mmetsp:Transcript_40527/g.86494  ORF Transcript_40527/g.86494 Transcript_40527/m.86494 type:complete len:309 (+) Transcript_40527:40-966(+)